jgi:ankyrin repeat protein
MMYFACAAFTGCSNEYADIHGAACSGDISAVRAFLRSGVDINSFDNHGETPLHHAVKCNRRNVVALLLTEGADVNMGTDRGDDTPLHYALMWGNWDIAKFLLENGADETKENAEGVSAKGYVVQQGTQELCDALRPKKEKVSGTVCAGGTRIGS